MSAPAPPADAPAGGVVGVGVGVGVADPSTWVRVLAPALFALAWLGMAFRWPLLPVGRTLSTMVCAVLCVSLGVISPDEAFASVSLATLALLFGSMVMAALLEREGFFTHVQRLWCMRLPAGSSGSSSGGGNRDEADAQAATAPSSVSAGGSGPGPASSRSRSSGGGGGSGVRGVFGRWMAGQGEYAAHHLLIRVVFSSGLLSALFTNDSWCVVGTPVLLRLCARFRLPYAPFLLALATSANIGSAASPVGNPQNMLIAASSGIGFAQFLRYLLLPSFLALAINAALLCAVYHQALSGHRITWTEAVLARAEADEIDEEGEGDGLAEVRDKPRRPSISALVESAKMLPPPSAEDVRAQRRHAHQYDHVHAAAEDDTGGAAAGAELRQQPSWRARVPAAAAQEAKSPTEAGEADVLLHDAPSSFSSSTSALRPLRSVVWPVADARGAAVALVDDAHAGAIADADVGADEDLDSETAFAALNGGSSRNNAAPVPAPAAARAPRAGAYPDLEPFLSATATAADRQWALDEYVRRAALEHFYSVDYRAEEERAAKAKLKAAQGGGGGEGGHAAAAPAHPALRFRRGGRYASPALPSAAASAVFNARARANNMPLSPPPPSLPEGFEAGDEENPAASASSPVAVAARAAARASGVGGRAGRLEMQPPSYASLAVARPRPMPPRGELALWLDRQGALGAALARCDSVSKVRLFSLVLAGTLVAFLAGAPLAWAALAGAIGMLLLDGADPDVSGLWHSAGVDWALLLFFASLFVVVDALRISGWPERAWAAAAPVLDVRTAGGAALYSLLILLGSNTVSNVPLVLILSPSLRALPDPVARHAAWLLLAFVSTLAGNLTLVGSVANLIVVARARRWYELKFWEYARFGSWTTVLLIAGGVAIILVELP